MLELLNIQSEFKLHSKYIVWNQANGWSTSQLCDVSIKVAGSSVTKGAVSMRHFCHVLGNNRNSDWEFSGLLNNKHSLLLMFFNLYVAISTMKVCHISKCTHFK